MTCPVCNGTKLQVDGLICTACAGHGHFNKKYWEQIRAVAVTEQPAEPKSSEPSVA